MCCGFISAARLRSQCYIARADALTMAREQPPDIILLSVTLPDMRGDDVRRELRADTSTRKIPVILFTQYDRRADILGQMIGGDDDIVIPFDVEELRLRVQNEIKAASRRDE
jgi:DNA-binding response OmpR family regulator